MKHSLAKVAIVAMTLLVVAAGGADGAEIHERLGQLLGDLPGDRISSGILLDRALVLSPLPEFDGSARSPAATTAEWRRMYAEIRRAALPPVAWPAPAALQESAASTAERGDVPIAIMNIRYDRLDPDALETGALRLEDDRLAAGAGEFTVQERLFAAAPLREETYHGARVTFRVDRRFYISNTTNSAMALEIDFDDGRGFRTAVFGREETVRYAAPGAKTLRLRMTLDDGTRLHAASVFQVRALETPVPDDTLQIEASIPYQGEFGTGEAYVYLSDAHTSLTNPVMLIEGFDIDNSMNWEELYALLNREELLETLRARGFDAVVLNFTDALDYIQRNAFVAVELIETVRDLVDPQQTLALAGASMGGLVGRYALASMEDNALEHRVRTFISFDSPQAGANIPLGLQYWIWFFADDSPDAEEFLAALDSPAARQMLAYHYTDPPGATGESDPLHSELLDELASLGGYPALPRRTAIINGSGFRTGQGFAAGDQIIQWEYSSFLVDITGNVWAVPDAAGQLIFHGLIDIVLLPEEEVMVTVSGTEPYDNAPGGWRASMAELAATEAPYGDIVALHPNHDFIPSVSALDLDADDLFYDIDGDPELLGHTPFDAVYYPVENQEHVAITAQNAEWFLSEIEAGTAGLGTAHNRPRLILRPARPTPFRHAAWIGFELPRAAPTILEVIEPGGRRVNLLLDQTLPAGRHGVTWTGLNEEGRPVSSGVYYYRLRSGGEVSTARTLKLN
ncbi:MAG: hypothetical protein GF355_14850 [Candidatus Eisenbacteria bacterium]|nr:hypothetical protein [Candidatus Eisenbacteria bacterium]